VLQIGEAAGFLPQLDEPPHLGRAGVHEIGEAARFNEEVFLYVF